MTMFARDLSVAHYRSFDSYRLALDEGVTILAGPNAAGKTNLIEALQLLTTAPRLGIRPQPSSSMMAWARARSS